MQNQWLGGLILNVNRTEIRVKWINNEKMMINKNTQWRRWTRGMWMWDEHWECELGRNSNIWYEKNRTKKLFRNK